MYVTHTTTGRTKSVADTAEVYNIVLPTRSKQVSEFSKDISTNNLKAVLCCKPM